MSKFAFFGAVSWILLSLLFAQENNWNYSISEISQKTFETFREPLLKKAINRLDRAKKSKENALLLLEQTKKQRIEQKKQLQEHQNDFALKLQIRMAEAKIKWLQNKLKVIHLQIRWAENTIAFWQKGDETLSQQEDPEQNPLYAFHQNIFQMFLPPDLPLTPEEKTLAIVIQHKIWKFIHSQNKTRNSFLFLMMILDIEDEENTFHQTHQKYYELTRSPLTAIRQLAKELRFLYLIFIYESELGRSISQYHLQAKPIIHPEMEAYINQFQATNSFAQGLISYHPETKEIIHQEGIFDYIIVGSGPAGSVLAHELRQKGKRVLLLERGSFVVPGALDPVRISVFKEKFNMRTSQDGAIIIRNGNIVGGGSAVNIDLAFAPTLPTIQARIEKWRASGHIDSAQFSREEIEKAYQWIVQKIGTRNLQESEINANNQILWKGSQQLGWKPSLYALNRFPENQSFSPVTEKISAVEAFLLKALLDPDNPLHLVPQAEVKRVLYEEKNGTRIAYGVEVKKLPVWHSQGIIKDLHHLNIPDGEMFVVKGKKIILSAGALGSPTLLLNSGVDQWNPQVGKGAVIHPSIPLIGLFPHKINIMEGLTASVYNDHFAIEEEHGFIWESMSAGPEYAAIMLQGSGKEIYQFISEYAYLGGFGVMLIDHSSSKNAIVLNREGFPEIQYVLTPEDKKRFRRGVQKGLQIMFAAGAKKVILPSTERLKKGNQQHPVFYTDLTEALEAVEQLEFVPNQTVLTSAHLQSTNKMGTNPASSVVDTNAQVWGIQHLYVVDGSIFPTSVGANPMQSIYTIAKIFADRWNQEE